jgi:hypothetical protein
MRSESASGKANLIERRILCALCSVSYAADQEAIRELSAHRWMDPEHRVVFEAFSMLPSCNVKSLRELLPTQATRMGFPDVDWARYFARPPRGSKGIRHLIRALFKTEMHK